MDRKLRILVFRIEKNRLNIVAALLDYDVISKNNPFFT